MNFITLSVMIWIGMIRILQSKKKDFDLQLRDFSFSMAADELVISHRKTRTFLTSAIALTDKVTSSVL